MMNFVLQTPSLQHLAGVKIVAALWNQRDILNQIARSVNPSYLDSDGIEKAAEWRAIEKRLKINIWAVSLPESCKKRLSKLIQPLRMEIINWRHCQCVEMSDCREVKYLLPRQFCWTMHGNVDNAKTAELMVKVDGRLSIELRYELACHNGLEDESRQAFERMSAEQRQGYVNYARAINMMRGDRRLWITYFTRTFTGDGHRLNDAFEARGDSINMALFEDALVYGDRALCDVWFAKLSRREKEQVLEVWPMQEPSFYYFRASNLLYYWSLMNEEQRERMFRERTGDVLLGLLRWPIQSLFLETVQRGWSYMNDYICSDVLHEIACRIACGFQDCYYSQLFWEFWRLCPAEYKQYYLDDISHLEGLFATKRREFIGLVLNEASWRQILALCIKYREISPVLMDESVIPDAALIECKEKAALISSRDRNNLEKRLRSDHLSRLVNFVMERRIERRLRPEKWKLTVVFFLAGFITSFIIYDIL